VSGATSYAICRSTTSGGESSTPIGTATGASYVDTGLTPGSTYYYQVIALNAVGGGFASTQASATIGTSAVSFVKTDTTTLGNWKGAYGADGWEIVGDPSGNAMSLPSYSSLTESGNSTYVWTTTSAASSSLEEAASGSTNRVAAIWYSNTAFSIQLDASDNNVHQVAFYLLDYSPGNRQEVITATTTVGSTVLDKRTVTSMAGGVYYVYNFNGNVTFTFARLAGSNSIVNGVFFGN
jgi:hypothetical protein